MGRPAELGAPRRLPDLAAEVGSGAAARARVIAWLGPGLALAAAVFYLIVTGLQLGRPLMYDDANFALGARAVSDTGQPFGNQGWMSERGDFSQREQWALWHPPLYIYLLGGVVHLGGWNPPVLRLLGLLGGLASGLLSYVLAVELTRGPPPARALAGGLATVLVLLCPLVVQSTLVVDIDLTLLLPLSLLFLLLYARLERAGAQGRRWLVLVPLFSLLLWAKMTNPLPLLAVIVTWQLLRGRPLRAGRDLLGIGLGGMALFGASWLLIGRTFGWPLDMPFGVNLVQWQDSADVARRAYTSPGAFLEGLQPSVLWLGPGLVALGLVGTAVRVAELARCWRFRRSDLLIGLLVLLVLGYVNKSAGGFAKYQVALAPLLAILAAPLLASAVCAHARLTTALSVLGALVAAIVTLRLVRDDWTQHQTWAVEPLAGAWLLGIVVVALLAGSLRRLAGPAALASLLGLTVGWSLGTDLYQAAAPYSTTYWYGTTGTSEAARWVDEHLAPEQTYVAAKEVAIRAIDQRYVDQDNLITFVSAGRGFNGTWAGEPVAALVVWQREPYVASLFERAAPAAGYHETARFGDYVVYEPGSGS